VSYEEEDTCVSIEAYLHRGESMQRNVSYEEEDTCVSIEAYLHRGESMQRSSSQSRYTGYIRYIRYPERAVSTLPQKQTPVRAPGANEIVSRTKP